ncbi:hypothetical protein LCGC14_2987620 [marine sediment metagenome]|uniref:Uncharacterized protein n=1 Tax=marine sediment metagenome TaxID=412755 RepID=A0A0F8XSB7_9ZZZZ
MTIAQAIKAANAARPISWNERIEARVTLTEAAEDALRRGFNVLAAARLAHLDKLQESAP